MGLGFFCLSVSLDWGDLVHLNLELIIIDVSLILPFSVSRLFCLLVDVNS